MPTPKHKIQRYRRDARRASNRLQAEAVSRCPRCNEEKLPHRVCSHCGYYKDYNVLKIEGS